MSVSDADAQLPEAGWYPDPEGLDLLRWWDGQGWVEQYRARPMAKSITDQSTTAPGDDDEMTADLAEAIGDGDLASGDETRSITDRKPDAVAGSDAERADDHSGEPDDAGSAAIETAVGDEDLPIDEADEHVDEPADRASAALETNVGSGLPSGDGSVPAPNSHPMATPPSSSPSSSSGGSETEPVPPSLSAPPAERSQEVDPMPPLASTASPFVDSAKTPAGSSPDGPIPDAGPTDSGPTDSGPTDSGPTDSGSSPGALAAPTGDGGDGHGAAGEKPPPAWYSDPSGRYEHRFWDGVGWTANVATDGVQSIDPVPPQ